MVFFGEAFLFVNDFCNRSISYEVKQKLKEEQHVFFHKANDNF